MALYSVAKSQGILEPMNASSYHPKVKLVLSLSDPVFVAGEYVSGKMEMECRGDKGLGIGVMMVDLFAIQELSSRDHSATSTFLHSRRLFQGPGLPPSNAVHAHPLPDEPPLPQPYHPGRRGHSTFLFRIPLPGTCPSSLNFAQGQAKVRYELRASAGVFWKNERRSVLSRMMVDVVDRYPMEEVIASGGKEPEGVVVGENGKLWVQGKVLGSVVVAGSTACLELQVKNHSTKKNTSLTLSLTRTLYLPFSSTTNTTQFPHPVHLSDTLTTVPFRGPEYIIPPGAEGVANLVFDVPKHARGVRGGMLDGEELEEGGQQRISESLFEVRCKVEVKVGMGMGSRDIRLEVPIDVVHPRALPPPNELIGSYAAPTSPAPADPFYSPNLMPYVDAAHNQVWLPPPAVYPPYSSPYHAQQFYGGQSPPPHLPMSPGPQPIATHTTGLGLTLGMPYPHPLSPVALNTLPAQAYLQPAAMPFRPLSAGPVASASQLPQSMVPGLPAPEVSPVRLLPLPEHMGGLLDNTSHAQGLQSPSQQQASPSSGGGYTPEQGKGERALRVSRHLKMSSRHRSVSPLSHRYRYPLPQPALQEEGEGDREGVDVGVPGLGRATRMLPVPPMANTTGTMIGELTPSLSTPPLVTAQHQQQATVVHSPRPQLTPKHSFTRDNAPAKSERVEELEKIADVVVKRSGNNLSGDVPKEMVEKVEEEVRERAKEKEKKQEDKAIVAAGGKGVSLKRNKTLPGPPDEVEVGLAFMDPLPFDQTPPTPTIHALSVRGRDRDKEKEKERAREREKHKELLQELRTESGLDALERRLLKEVGTRKMNAPPRPDVRSVLGVTSSPLPHLGRDSLSSTATGASAVAVDTILSTGQGRNGGTVPIPIPVKSPEPLNDSAISSLTLAGALGEDDDSDGGRTHRAGSRSRSGSLDRGILVWRSGNGNGNGNAFHRHMRERAEVTTRTPTETPEEEREKERPSKESKASHHRKKGKSAAAKGRVAAWLGRIDVGVPPQEQVIPPSPSVVRAPDQVPDLDLEGAGSGDDGEVLSVQEQKDNGKGQETKVDTVNAEPNPRSSGFVPIVTLNRNTIQLPDMSRPLILRDGTIVEEARKVQALWSTSTSSSATPAVAGTPTLAQTQYPQRQQAVHKFPMPLPSLARAQSIRTDRRVSPPSTKPMPSLPVLKENKDQVTDRGVSRGSTGPTMSYSAAARNVWKQVDLNPAVGALAAGRVTDAPPLALTAASKPLLSGRLPAFSPLKPPVDPEVKYDIRSARGGRGGKVMTVANLWASGAITNQANSNLNNITTDGRARIGMSEVVKITERGQEEGDKKEERRIEEGRRKTVQEDEKKMLKPTPPSKDTKALLKTGKKLFSAALKAPAPSARSVVGTASIAERPGPPPTATKPVTLPNSSPGAGPSKPRLETQKRLDSRKVFQAPNTRSSNALLQNRPATAMSNSGPERLGRLHVSGGKAIPMFTSLSTPSSPDSKLPDLATAGGGSKPKPAIIIPPLTNPATAVLSSSHAIPHLSSTASLARPHTSSSATSAADAPRPGYLKLPALISASTSVPSLSPSTPGRNSNTALTLPNKPADLSFGQARLKDLIKKYQG